MAQRRTGADNAMSLDPDNTVSLIMPMAGRGSRFARGGMPTPKPLIEIQGRPFFWWAIESVRRAVPVSDIVCIVQQADCKDFRIDQRIAQYYPHARIRRLDGVTSGAAETAWLGLDLVQGDGVVAVNDCDHAFVCLNLPRAVARMRAGAAGALLCFASRDPAYSYVRLNDAGTITGTVEKQPVSGMAIAGCYIFASQATYRAAYEIYRNDCPYSELFISGIYDRLLKQGNDVVMELTERHFTFGTPGELERLDITALQSAFGVVS
jgi:dTDP-glucose pyrophosphorylase